MARQNLQRSSTTAAVAKIQDLKDIIPVAEGVSFRDDEERLIYDQFARSRQLNQWREFDLLLLSKAARIERDIRSQQSSLEEMGLMLENKRGTQIPNPMITIIDGYERRLLAIIRTLSLGVSADKAGDLNKSGTKKQEADDLKKIKKGNAVNLLAH